MRFRFKLQKLRSLYETGHGARRYPKGMVAAFAAMASIVAATDERDLYALKSLHFERLKGKREGQHSIRLNDHYRLILTMEEDEQGKVLHVIEIADYH